MRLAEIVEAVKDNHKVGEEKLRHAICVMDSLMVFDRTALSRLRQAEIKGAKPFMTSSAVWQYKERHGRLQRAFNKPPKEWLGPDNLPENEAYQERRGKATRLLDNIANGKFKKRK